MNLLSTHGLVLAAIAQQPDIRLREIAENFDLAERTVWSAVDDLVNSGALRRYRNGSRSKYVVVADARVDSTLSDITIGELLSVTPSEHLDLDHEENSPPLDSETPVRRAPMTWFKPIDARLSDEGRVALIWLVEQHETDASVSRYFDISSTSSSATINWPGGTQLTVDRTTVDSLVGLGLVRGNPAARTARFELRADAITLVAWLRERTEEQSMIAG